MKIKKALIGAVVALLLALPVLAQAPGPSDIREFDFADAGDTICTNSSVYGALPGMSITFNMGQRGDHRSLALFQVEFTDFNNEQAAQVRAVVDGTPLANSDVMIHFIITGQGGTGGQGLYAGTYGFQFITGPLAAGQHTLSLEWRHTFGQQFGQICVARRSLVILHR